MWPRVTLSLLAMDLPQIEGAAAPGTSLGLLQRGRGAGWLQAAESEFGRELLVACLQHEPRWDRQVESRADYYATLILHLGISLHDFARELVDEQDRWILVEVLDAMARRGSADASQLLRLVPDHDDAPTSISATTRANRPRRARPMTAGADASIEELLADPGRGSYPKAVLHRLRITTDPHEVAALRDASRDREHRGWHFAVRVLGIRGDTTPLGVIEDVLMRNEPGPTRAAAFQYVRALPGHITLPLARAWLTSDDGRGEVAPVVFASHAELPDAPAIRTALANATDYYTASSLAQALGRLPEAGPFPELEEVYSQSAYSFARARAVEAMAATDPDFGQKWAIECLWDCEEGARIQGARRTPAEPKARARLQQLANDVHEDPEVRHAARVRVH